MHKVKIYSLPKLAYQGAIRMRDHTPEKIAHRMGGAEDCNPDAWAVPHNIAPCMDRAEF